VLWLVFLPLFHASIPVAETEEPSDDTRKVAELMAVPDQQSIVLITPEPAGIATETPSAVRCNDDSSSKQDNVDPIIDSKLKACAYDPEGAEYEAFRHTIDPSLYELFKVTTAVFASPAHARQILSCHFLNFKPNAVDEMLDFCTPKRQFALRSAMSAVMATVYDPLDKCRYLEINIKAARALPELLPQPPPSQPDPKIVDDLCIKYPFLKDFLASITSNASSALSEKSPSKVIASLFPVLPSTVIKVALEHARKHFSEREIAWLSETPPSLKRAEEFYWHHSIAL